MNANVLEALGGLGLFLLGMAIMTGALKAMADEKLRSLLIHAVDSPIKGAITGALATAVLQSSSAVTVAAVGFVGAGLFTFSESLGVIFGANIGTTMTGWLVALLGLKLNLGQMLLPLILLGVLLKLTGRPRLEQAGMAIAGFGLIFVGISALQSGLTGLEGQITPDHFPADTILGRLLLVLIGVIITVITQSSSAGVATALAAVNTGTLSLNQAAAMVIGMNVGTTATAALASIGGNVQARRTGFAHVIYNILTAVAAFLLLTPFMQAVAAMFPGAQTSDPELVLVGFHTFFNFLGVCAILPFTKRFANLLIRLFPERGNPLTTQLDRSLLADPGVAVVAVKGTLWTVARSLLGELNRHLRNVSMPVDAWLLGDVRDAIDQCNGYLQELSGQFQGPEQVQEYVAYLHVLDHLLRIESRVREEQRLNRCRDDEQLAAMSDELSAAATVLIEASPPIAAEEVERVHSINRSLKTAMRESRIASLKKTSEAALTTLEALRRMDTARTIRRIGYHIWRIANHLAGPSPGLPERGERRPIDAPQS